MRFLRSALGIGAVMLVGAAMGLAGVGSAHAQGGSAFVRVVHAAPAAPDVDVYVDGSKLLSDFKFGTVTGYVPVPVGAHEIDVTGAGKPAAEAVIKQSVTVAAGANYTVAAIGDANTSPALAAFVDDNSVAGGKAKVRVYHLSSDAGPVAVATGGKTVIPDLTFPHASDYLAVAPGNYTFDVTLKNSGKAVPTSAALAANKVTSVFALGLINGSGDTAFKFAAAVVSAVPTGMPQTGFNPHPTPANASTTAPGVYVGLVLLILLSGGTGLVMTRRRIR